VGGVAIGVETEVWVGIERGGIRPADERPGVIYVLAGPNIWHQKIVAINVVLRSSEGSYIYEFVMVVPVVEILAVLCGQLKCGRQCE
jgi:hypothetical protein